MVDTDPPTLPSLDRPYDQSTANEIRDALDADAPELSAAELESLINYEEATKDRITVTRLAESYLGEAATDDEPDVAPGSEPQPESDTETDSTVDSTGDDVPPVDDGDDDPPTDEESSADEVNPWSPYTSDRSTRVADDSADADDGDADEQTLADAEFLTVRLSTPYFGGHYHGYPLESVTVTNTLKVRRDIERGYARLLEAHY